MKRIYVLTIAVLISACAQKPLTIPNSTGVSGGLARVQTGVKTAQSQHSEIAARNVEARTDLSRADAKDAVIKAWRAWKKEHP